MRKYSKEMGLAPQVALNFKCCLALASITKKAEAEELQDTAASCLHSLVPCLEYFMGPAIDTIQNITRNNQDTTHKLVRAGGLVDWLVEESSVVKPDQPKPAAAPTKGKRK